MIRRIYANQAGFHEVSLKPGLNVILAERTKDATRKDTRNGVGKSTLLEVVHFCLGSDGATLKSEALTDWEFGLDLVVGGREVSVTRSIRNPKKVTLDGDLDGLPVELMRDRASGRMALDVKDWSLSLGALMFGLPVHKTKGTYEPTFRSLISYFARRGKDAFSSPFEHFRKQQEWDKQVNLAYLLNLSWEDARDTQTLRDRKAALAGLKKAVQGGLLKGHGGKRSDLENLRIRLEQQAHEEGERLATFRVHEQYDEIRSKSDKLTDDIHTLVDSNFQNGQLVALYAENLGNEVPSDESEVERLFEEAGVVLGSSVVKRLQDVRDFHRTIIANRHEFLASECERLKRDMSEKAELIRKLSDERADLMMVLQTHGALEEYNRLQQLHLRTLARVQEVKDLLENIGKLETGTSELKIEKELLLQRGRRDYEERHLVRAKAVNYFNANSQQLYAASGRLLVDFLQTGFKFDVDIERQGSDGIDNMTIFCFDLMLAQLWSERAPRPGFLWHDSRVFDSDPRQRAQAIELVARESLKHGFQYVCALNSDTVPHGDFSLGFNIDQYVRLRLTDAAPEGSLLGMRF